MRNQYLVETACPRVPALTHQYLELGLPLNSALRAAEADLWEPENLGLCGGAGSYRTLGRDAVGPSFAFGQPVREH